MNEIRKFIEIIKNIGNTNKEMPSSLMESFQMNGFSITKDNDPTAKTVFIGDELNEATIEEFQDNGGIIVFSTEINAVKSSDNIIINFIKNKLESIKNVFNKKINKVISKHENVYGITIGNFVKGRYKAGNEQIYDEKSLSIEIIGIDSETLNNVADDIRKEFNQEAVLVKNYNTNKIYLLK
jgi:hypothetical protein